MWVILDNHNCDYQSAQYVIAADVDGDGRMDLASVSANDDKIAWYRNVNGDGSSWTTTTVTTSAGGAQSVIAADVDGDGRMDLASASRNDHKIAWHSPSCLCPVGRFGDSVCQHCPAGKYGLIGQAACSDCNAGKFNEQTAQTSSDAL